VPRQWLCILVTAWTLGTWSGAVGFSPGHAAKAAEAGASSGGSVSESIKGGMKKLSDMFSPRTTVVPADDPTSLSTPAKPSPELYVSMGLLLEQQSRFAEAEQRYQQALKLNSNHLGALVAMARLKDRQKRFDDAVRLYEQAAKAHPNQSVVFNDLGLCHARRGRLREAVAQMERAVQLKPDEVRYRNNLATVLVELGDVDRAFVHLQAVHGEATALYNLGYLMYKKGQTRAAAVLFAKALEKEPGMAEARDWLERLGAAPTTASSMPTGSAVAQQRAALPPRAPYAPMRPAATPAGVQPSAPTASPVHRLPGATPQIRQLPPVSHPAAPRLTGAGMATVNDAVEDAPLPPAFGVPSMASQAYPAQTAPMPPERTTPSAVHALPPIDSMIQEP